ncbi:hypothetical protein ACFX1S_022431 [Malus domestica]
MSGPFDRRFDLNLGEEAVPPSPNNLWRPSFISSTGPLTVGDSVVKNDMTAAVVAQNLVTPRDNRLLSKRSDELAVKDSLALSVQCAGSVSNMAQRLFARTRQVESLAAKVMSLKQEIRGLKQENKYICLRLLGLYRVMKLQMINLRCLLLLGFRRVMWLQTVNLRRLSFLGLCQVVRRHLIVLEDPLL